VKPPITLGDQPLEPPPAGVHEELLPVAVAMRKEADVPVEVQGPAKQLLARTHREAGRVVALEVDDVEQVVEDGDAGAPCTLGVRDPQPSLEPGEAGDVVLEGDYLSVDDELRGALVLQGLHQLGVGVVEQLVRARLKSHAFWGAVRQAALTVELPFVDPVGV
jgi:hypothetical protein